MYTVKLSLGQGTFLAKKARCNGLSSSGQFLALKYAAILSLLSASRQNLYLLPKRYCVYFPDFISDDWVRVCAGDEI